jgi:membrane fusion protein (multidrug efflux system)
VTHDQQGQATALVVGADNKVALRTIQATRTFGANWVVDGGLNQGEKVIVSGRQKVQPGALVRAVETSAAPASQNAASPQQPAAPQQAASPQQPASAQQAASRQQPASAQPPPSAPQAASAPQAQPAGSGVPGAQRGTQSASAR